MTKAATDADFADILASAETPVLIDFWAPWCGPCKTMKPVLEDISRDYDGRLTVITVNAEENPNTAAAYGVRGLPTLAIADGGAVMDMRTGAMTKPALSSWIDDAI